MPGELPFVGSRKCDSHLIKAQFLIDKLRFRYKGNHAMNAVIDRYLWYSVEMVWGMPERTKTERAIRNRKQKKKRVTGRLYGMAKRHNDLYFVTLTWKDEYLAKLSDRTRLRYVKEWLTGNCDEYVANQDFAPKTEREHYHAVVALSRILDLRSTWKYGSINIQRINTGTSDRKRLATYLTKLANHAGKIGTGTLIFSRQGSKEQTPAQGAGCSGATVDIKWKNIETQEDIDELPF